MLQVRKHIITLGQLAVQAVREGSSALLQHNAELARSVSIGDAPLNRERQLLEARVYDRLADQHAASAESRWLVSAVVVAQALERIGDSAASMAWHTVRLQRVQNGHGGQPLPIEAQLTQMAEVAVTLIEGALAAFLDGDHRKAEDLVRYGYQLNELYEDALRVFDATEAHIGVPSTPVDEEMLMLWAAHSLVRMADFVVSICERTIFLTTGELKEFN